MLSRPEALKSYLVPGAAVSLLVVALSIMVATDGAQVFMAPKLWHLVLLMTAFTAVLFAFVARILVRSRQTHKDAAETLFQTVVEACSDPIAVMDSTGRIVFVNHAAERLL